MRPVDECDDARFDRPSSTLAQCLVGAYVQELMLVCRSHGVAETLGTTAMA